MGGWDLTGTQITWAHICCTCWLTWVLNAVQVTEVSAQLHDAETKLKTVTEKLALSEAEATAAQARVYSYQGLTQANLQDLQDLQDL